MSNHKVYIDFPGRLVMIGFGSIGQGVLPLILRHIGNTRERITVVTGADGGREEAEKVGIEFIFGRRTRGSFSRVLAPLVGRGDFVLNVCVVGSSIALMK